MARKVLFVEGPLDGMMQTIPDLLNVVNAFDDFAKSDVIYKVVPIKTQIPGSSIDFYFGVLQGRCGHDVLKRLVANYENLDRGSDEINE